MNQRSKSAGSRSRGVGGGLSLSLITADLLLDGLAEPSSHSLGPVLVEVLAGDDYIQKRRVQNKLTSHIRI